MKNYLILLMFLILTSCDGEAITDLYIYNTTDEPIEVTGAMAQIKSDKNEQINYIIGAYSTQLIYVYTTIPALSTGKEGIPSLFEELHIKLNGNETKKNPLDINNWDYYEETTNNRLKYKYNAILQINPEDFE